MKHQMNNPCGQSLKRNNVTFNGRSFPPSPRPNVSDACASSHTYLHEILWERSNNVRYSRDGYLHFRFVFCYDLKYFIFAKEMLLYLVF